MAAYAEPAYREQLSAMIGELQANRVVLDHLLKQCAMFRFTGGTIPTQGWSISRMTSYLTSHSRPAGGIATKDVQRYLGLIENLDEFQLEVANAARPRTLRHRHAVTDAAGQTLTEILSLESYLESAIERSLHEVEPWASIH